MSCDDSSLFRWITLIQTLFLRKVKYNLVIETFEDDFSLYASLLGLLRLRARS